MSSVSQSHPSSRRYSESFKLKAVRMVLEQNLSIQQAAEKLHCSPMSVRHWLDQYRDHVTGQRSDSDILPDLADHCQPPFPKKRGSVPFLPIQVVDESASSTPVPHYEIVTPNGLTLRLPDGITFDLLAILVRELESSCCAGGTSCCAGGTSCCAGGTRPC